MTAPAPLRVLLADDEPLARALLRRMLAEHDDVVVVGEAAEGEAALALVRAERPDVLFLDVQMPRLTGPELIRALGAPAPAIVFVTAFDAYAVEAFELRAVDYLLKPFDEERLADALARVRERAAPPPSDVAAMLELALGRAQRVGGRIFLTDGPRTVIRRFEDIDWLEADRKVVRVHAAGHTYTTPGPLAALEQRLDPQTFARVSRSVIVNLDRVAEIQPWFGAELVLIMADGARLTTSRGYRARLDRVMGRVPRHERD